jgi:hypothetical protein
MLRRLMRDKQMRQALQHIVGLEPVRYDDRQAAPSVLVGAIPDEVVGPDVIGPFRPRHSFLSVQMRSTACAQWESRPKPIAKVDAAFAMSTVSGYTAS